MISVLLRALALALIILLGIVMRSAQLVPKEAGMIVRQLMFYLTIPAALIVFFSKIQEMSAQMFWVAVFGMVANAAMLCMGFVLVRGWADLRGQLRRLRRLRKKERPTGIADGHRS